VRYLVAVLGALTSIAHEGKLRVLDFGGGNAPLYRLVRRTLPLSVRLEWFVVELPVMVAAGQHAPPEVSYVTAIAQVPHPIDLVVSDACIQYVASIPTVLGELAEAGPAAMVISRLPLHERDSGLMLMQRVRSKSGTSEFPMHVLSSLEWLALVRRSGFEPTARWVGGEGYRIRYGFKAVDVYGFVIERSAAGGTRSA
jgi:putative methyltransferase (TIGR04325 family)